MAKDNARAILERIVGTKGKGELAENLRWRLLKSIRLNKKKLKKELQIKFTTKRRWRDK